MNAHEQARQIVNEKLSQNEALRKLANAAGCSLEEARKFVEREAYRREYNARPEVIAKRKERNRVQNEKLKAFRLAMRSVEEGLLVKQLVDEKVAGE